MKSYNNAFEILTDDPIKLQDYEDRSDLMDEMNDSIKSLDLSKSSAAKRYGVDEKTVSELILAQISKFPHDKLIQMMKFGQSSHSLNDNQL